MALGGDLVDPGSYTALRLTTGALSLWLVVIAARRWRSRWKDTPVGTPGDWPAAALLSLYAVAFSYAFVTLSAGTGALILFAAVQVTMILRGMQQGERPRLPEWAGLCLALGGLAWLVSPGLSAPDPLGSGLMAAAGVAWGGYSLRGRAGEDPLDRTAGNFLRAVAIAALLLPAMGIAMASAGTLRLRLSAQGILWASLSGSVSSGLGYVLWYAALRGLTATRAAIVQLAVPVLAALGGVLLLGESLTLRLALSGAVILGGVALAVAGRRATAARPGDLPPATPRSGG